MKLYNLFEDIIFEEIGKNKGLITEGVSEDEIIKAMDGKYNVKIMYRGEGETTPQPRTIQVYVYGQLQSGDYAIRAYQVDGYSKKNNQHDWKILRTDRISSWTPTKMKWNKAVSDYNIETDDMSKGGNVGKYNPNGDKKGNFMRGQSVNTFRRIIKQFGGSEIDKTQQKPVGTPATPAIAKPSIAKPAIAKPTTPSVAKPITPSVKTPPVEPKINQPVIKPTGKKEPDLEKPEMEDNKLNKNKPNF